LQLVREYGGGEIGGENEVGDDEVRDVRESKTIM
jgi:hypothetical protein